MRSAARGLDEAARMPPGYKLLEVPTEMMLSPAIVGLDVLIYWPEGRGTQRDDRDMAWHPGTIIRVDNDRVIMKYQGHWARGEEEEIQKFIADRQVAYSPDLLEYKIAMDEAKKILREKAGKVIVYHCSRWWAAKRTAKWGCKAVIFALEDGHAAETFRAHLQSLQSLPLLPCAKAEVHGDGQSLFAWGKSLLSAANVEFKSEPAPECFSPGVVNGLYDHCERHAIRRFTAKGERTVVILVTRPCCVKRDGTHAYVNTLTDPCTHGQLAWQVMRSMGSRGSLLVKRHFQRWQLSQRTQSTSPYSTRLVRCLCGMLTNWTAVRHVCNSFARAAYGGRAAINCHHCIAWQGQKTQA